MSISKQVMGMNARNFLYIGPYNKARAKRRADDKLLTKKALLRAGIPTAKLLHAFSNRGSIKSYSWDLPEGGFALKPARGYGGEGILIFNRWVGQTGTTISGKKYTLKQIQSYIYDIFDGIYSLQSLPDRAYIEEMLIPSQFFQKFSPAGIPDIRVIVFNKIPVMAMLRIPTAKSHGKANLHAGAVGIGIEFRTGITKHATYESKPIRFIPDTKIKTNGIKIPDWDEILLLASRAQIVSELGFAGVDIVIEKKRGPVVLEINARPGLSIQTANLASLRSRLERIENLNVSSSERAVEIAKSVFADDFSEKILTVPKVLSVIELITISNGPIKKSYKAKLDTGAYRTSLDASVVKELKLPILGQTFKTVSASGREIRPAIQVEFELAGKKISTVATVATRTHLKFPIIIGRRDLKGFHINPTLTPRSETEIEADDRQN